MNAYDLYEAAFDSAVEEKAETIEHIQGYADGAFDLYVPDNVAQTILNCIAASRAATEENGEYENNHYHLVEAPLKGIEL